MNLLEQYIVEVHEVKPFTEPWTQEEWAKGKTWIEVDHTTNCYGVSKRSTRIFEKQDWQSALEKGHYLA